MATRVFNRPDLIGATLRKVDLFSKWPADVVDKMAAASQLWRVAKGEAIVEANTPSIGLYVLADGSAINLRVWPSGKQMATTIMRPGWSIGLVPAWDGIEYIYTIIARSDLHVVLLPRADFLVAARGDPKRLEDIITFTCTQIRQDSEGLQTRANGSLHCLMAKYLAYLARPTHYMSLQEPDAVDPTAFDVTQEELAAMLYVSRQTVNQMMKTMERDGVIVRDGNRLRIVNFLKLLVIMEEDEPIYHAWRDQIVRWDAKLRAMESTKPAEARDSATQPAAR